MVSTKLFIVVVAVLIGSIIIMNQNQVEADYQNIGIAPTEAIERINVQTSPNHQLVNDTVVKADVYNELIWFVSDGSIIFNVTEAYNSTHAFP